jgi:hypothetical protein
VTYQPGDLYQVTTLPSDDPAARAVASVFEPGEIVQVREIVEGAPAMEVPPDAEAGIHVGRGMRVPPECEQFFVAAPDQEPGGE